MTDPAWISVDPTTDPRWDTLVRTHRTDVFHSPAWMRVLRDTYGMEPEARLLSDASGSNVAGMAFVRIRDLLDPRTVSLPFTDFCDPVVTDPVQWKALTDDLTGGAERFRLRCVHTEVPLSDPCLSEVGRARWHGVDLTRGVAEMWDALDSSARRAIRKSQANGVTVRFGSSIADVRSFFEMHLAVRKHKYELLAQPWAFFERIHEHLVAPGQGRVALAEHDGRVVGGILLLDWADTTYYKFNASRADALDVRCNDLMIWEALQASAEAGRSRFDFGLSDWDQDGLVRFKRKFATEERTIHFLERGSDREPSRSDAQLRALLPVLTQLLTDPAVPDAITERGGDALYRYFA